MVSLQQRLALQLAANSIHEINQYIRGKRERGEREERDERERGGRGKGEEGREVRRKEGREARQRRGAYQLQIINIRGCCCYIIDEHLIHIGF